MLTTLLVLADLLTMTAVVRFGTRDGSGVRLMIATCVALLACRAAGRLYRSRLRLAYLDDVPRVVVSAGAGFLVTVGALVIMGRGTEPIAAVAGMVLWVALLAEVPRALVLVAARTVRRRLGWGERTLVLADGSIGDDLVATMSEHPEFGLRPVGRMSNGIGAKELAHGVAASDANAVLVAAPLPHSEVLDTVIAAHRLGCSVLVLPALYELLDDRPNIERLRSFPLIRMSGDPTRRPSWRIKRLLDILVAGAMLVLLAPVMAALAVAVLLTLGRPVLFAQQRVGLGGEAFRLLKFRSLPVVDDSESATRWSVTDDARLTRVSRLLRATSLDELPQLVNVLRGEMSIVGPRPERPVFVEQFAAAHGGYGARHRVPAGITGLAQVNGLRGDTSIADRARYDNYYIASWSLWLDVRIVLLTAGELARHAWEGDRSSRPRPAAPRALR